MIKSLNDLLIAFDCNTQMELEDELWTDVGVNLEATDNGLILSTTHDWTKSWPWSTFTIQDVDKALEEAEESYMNHPVGCSC